jgi:hypothetical protein
MGHMGPITSAPPTGPLPPTHMEPMGPPLGVSTEGPAVNGRATEGDMRKEEEQEKRSGTAVIGPQMGPLGSRSEHPPDVVRHCALRRWELRLNFLKVLSRPCLGQSHLLYSYLAHVCDVILDVRSRNLEAAVDVSGVSNVIVVCLLRDRQMRTNRGTGVDTRTHRGREREGCPGATDIFILCSGMLSSRG